MVNQAKEAKGLPGVENSNGAWSDGRETPREGSLQRCSPRPHPRGSSETEVKPGQRPSGAPLVPPPPRGRARAGKHCSQGRFLHLHIADT